MPKLFGKRKKRSSVAWLTSADAYDTLCVSGYTSLDKNPEVLFEKPDPPSKSFHLGIEEKDKERVIGDIWVYLIENDRMATIAIRLSPSEQKKGYGTEAVNAMTHFVFENTEIKRLWTKVDVRNVPSQRMLEKCGYTREGMIRQGKMVNSWCDYYIYGILSSDI